MIPNTEIIISKNIQQALELLSGAEDVKIIAGGTDMIPGFHINSPRFSGIKKLIDINRIIELKKIDIDNEFITIGSACTFSEIKENEIVQKHLPVLLKAAAGIGNTQIRNRATIAGNFINNAPCADTVPALLVYEAKIKIQSLFGGRTINLEDLLICPYKTMLNNDEIVTQILIPLQSILNKGFYYKLGRRRAVSISRISLACLINKNDDDILTEFKIASGAVTPIGQRFYEVEKMAVGQKGNDVLYKDIAIKTGEAVLDAAGLRWSTLHKLPVLQQALYQLLSNVE